MKLFEESITVKSTDLTTTNNQPTALNNMQNAIDPTKARVLRDIKHYRSKIKKDPNGAAVHIKDHLKKKDPKYGNSGADITSADAYRDFASWQGQSGAKATLPNRLGGMLDPQKPNHLNNFPVPKPATKVKWKPAGHANDIEVEVRADGAIVHKDANGNEIHDAHHYMHGIFDTILYRTRELLDAINSRLEAYVEQYSEDNPAQNEAGAYLSAVTAFNDYYDSLQPGGSSPFSGAFTLVGIHPVVTNEGFIVSCRVKLNWKNPYHSSSTIMVP